MPLQQATVGQAAPLAPTAPAPPAPAPPAPPAPADPSSSGPAPQQVPPASVLSGGDPSSYGQPTPVGQNKSMPIHRGSGTRFSGAPLWRFALRRDEQRRLQEEEEHRHGVPDGFVRNPDGYYYNPHEKRYWQASTQ